jgi:hypothetical protein
LLAVEDKNGTVKIGNKKYQIIGTFPTNLKSKNLDITKEVNEELAKKENGVSKEYYTYIEKIVSPIIWYDEEQKDFNAVTSEAERKNAVLAVGIGGGMLATNNNLEIVDKHGYKGQVYYISQPENKNKDVAIIRVPLSLKKMSDGNMYKDKSKALFKELNRIADAMVAAKKDTEFDAL